MTSSGGLPAANAPLGRWAWLALAVFGGLGVAIAVLAPSLIANRFVPVIGIAPETFSDAAQRVARGLAGAFAGVLGIACLQLRGLRPAALEAATRVAAVLAFLGLSTALWSWIVDDAAITFAYAANLLDGHGLVLHPSHPREEGYSATLWLLILAATGGLGLPLGAVAKWLGLACGAAAIALVLRAVPRSVSRPDLAVPAAVVVSAPFVVWSSSGLEHGLQACLIALVISAPALFSRRALSVIAVALSALVLLRPEAPLLVVAAFAVFALDRWRSAATEGMHPQRLARLLPIAPVALVPFAVWCALQVFRLAYFGDFWPNPYYAKVQQSGAVAHALNPLGGAWRYVFDYLSASHAFVLLPILLLGRLDRSTSLAVRLAWGIVVAQLSFVLYVLGDWMGQSRFIAPMLPALALVVAHALGQVRAGLGPWQDRVLRGALVGVLAVGTLSSLVAAVGGPTTPVARVSSIGRTFVAIARELGVEHPSLAHHDAGGTSFEAGIDVVDLGGLGNRAIAQHMRDREFVLDYLLRQRKPTFVFGGSEVFVAGSTRFYDAPEFARDYVALRVEGAPFMDMALCFVRRDVARPTGRIELERADGELVRVVARLGD